MADEDHSQDLEDMGAELKRREMAFKFMAQQLNKEIEEKTLIGGALNTATILIDQLLTDLRVAGGTPSAGLLLAKQNFDTAMRKLLKRKPEETTYVNVT